MLGQDIPLEEGNLSLKKQGETGECLRSKPGLLGWEEIGMGDV